MKVLKLLCLGSCLWWCWLNITVTAGCYSASGNLLACMDHMEDQMAAPVTSAWQSAKHAGR